MNKAYYLEVTAPPEDALYLGNASDDDKLLNEYSTSINSGYGTSGNAERIKPQISKWQSVDINAIGEGKNWTGIAYGLGMYIAIEEGENSDSYYTSEDGRTWQKRTFNLGVRVRRYIAFVGDRFWVFEENAKRYEYSTDGITWTNTTYSPEFSVNYACYGNDIWLFGNEANIKSSTSGASGAIVTLPTDIPNGWADAAHGKDNIVIINNSTNDKVILTNSSNTTGIIAVWAVQKSDIETAENYCGIAYGNGKFVIICNSITDIFRYSEDDGNSWKEGRFPQSIKALSIAYGNGIFFVTIYNSKKYLYSYDGLEWLEGELEKEYQYSQVFALNDGFVIMNDAKIRDINYSYSEYQMATVSPAPQTEKLLGGAKAEDIAYGESATSTEGYDITGTGQRAYPEPIAEIDITHSFRSITNVGEIVYDEKQKKLFAYTNDDLIILEKDIAQNKEWKIAETKTSKQYYPNCGYISSVMVHLSVAYHNGKYVALDSFKYVITSSDGKKWSVALSSLTFLTAVKWLNDRFLVIDRYKFYYSTDGKTFTEASRSGLQTSKGYWSDAAYGNGTYVAICSATSSATSGNTTIAYSTDNCASWTQKTLSSSIIPAGIAYGNGIFVLLPKTGQNYYTSTDGINWTSRATLPSNASNIQNNCITFVSAAESATIGNLFLIGKGEEDKSTSYQQTNIYYTSTDGINWTVRTWSIEGHCNKIKLENGRLYALFNRSEKLLSSADGINWTEEELNAYSNIAGVAYNSNGTQLAVLTQHGGISYSPNNGNTWTINKIPCINYFATGYKSMAYGKGIYLICGNYNSSNGYPGSEENNTFWTEDLQNFYKTNIGASATAVYFLGDMFFLTKDDREYYYSYDGKTLEKGKFPAVFEGQKLKMAYGRIYMNGTYVVITENAEYIAWSMDGIIWTLSATPELVDEKTAKVTNIVWGNGTFLADLSNGSYLYSTSGTAWTCKNDILNIACSILYCNGVFYNGRQYLYTYNTKRKEQKLLTTQITNNLYATAANKVILYSRNMLRIQIIRTPTYYMDYLGNATKDYILKGRRGSNKFGYAVEGQAEQEGYYPVNSKVLTSNIEYTSAYWNNMEYGNGIFILGGSSILTLSTISLFSTNGTKWKINAFRKINFNKNTLCFGNGKFIYTTGTTLYYSIDGKKWTIVNKFIPTSLGSAGATKYLNNQFVATGYQALYYSTDGENWIQSERNGIITTGNYWNDIAYGNGMYVMIYTTGNTGTIAYSTDLENWTEKNIGSFRPYRITYGNGKFVIVCNTSKYIAYSSDGINWTTSDSAIDTNITFQTLEYGNNLFIAAEGSFGVSTYYTSTDGVSWTKRSFPINRGICSNVKYRNNYWYAIFQEEYRILRSSDGINWSSYMLNTSGTGGYFQEIAYGNGILLAGGRYSEWFKSIDGGKNWVRKEFSERFLNISSYSTYRLVYGNGVFTYVYNNTNKYYSRDGESFIKISSSVAEIYNTYFLNNMFFYILNNSSTTTYYTSTDGITLTRRTAPFALSYSDVMCYGNGKYVLWKQDASNAAYSTDGINWTNITIPTPTGSSKKIYQMAYGNGRFVASITSTETIISTDGINWSIAIHKNSFSSSVFFMNGIFVTGTYYYSYDGVNWKNYNLLRGSYFNDYTATKIGENEYTWQGGQYVGVLKKPAEDAYYLGDARPEDIPKGIRFSSIHGYGLIGTKE